MELAPYIRRFIHNCGSKMGDAYELEKDSRENNLGQYENVPYETSKIKGIYLHCNEKKGQCDLLFLNESQCLNIFEDDWENLKKEANGRLITFIVDETNEREHCIIDQESSTTK
jgi:hypothetical protein